MIKKLNKRNMKECYKNKSHVSSKLHMIYIYIYTYIYNNYYYVRELRWVTEVL